MEWLTTSTLVAPLVVSSWFTRVAISCAVVALLWLVLYENAISCASVYPSALKRATMVFQVLALLFQPCTNRMGCRVVVVGVRASDASIPVGESPHAARASAAATSAA